MKTQIYQHVQNGQWMARLHHEGAWYSTGWFTYKVDALNQIDTYKSRLNSGAGTWQDVS